MLRGFVLGINANARGSGTKITELKLTLWITLDGHCGLISKERRFEGRLSKRTKPNGRMTTG